jgi:large subunit ribosomal protein L21
MFAVVRTGGKQYRVAKDDIIEVEKLDAEAGSTVQLGEVLMVGNEAEQTVGAPLVDGATVAAEVVTQKRGDKILVFKKKRRKHYRRLRGHRQHLTVLRVTDILTGGRKPAKTAAKVPAKAEEKPAPKKAEETPAVEKPAAAKPAAKPAAEKPAAAAKPAEKKPAAKAKPAAKKPAPKAKPAAKKPAAKKPAAKAKPAAKKPAAKKPAAKKPAAKKPKE